MMGDAGHPRDFIGAWVRGPGPTAKVRLVEALLRHRVCVTPKLDLLAAPSIDNPLFDDWLFLRMTNFPHYARKV